MNDGYLTLRDEAVRAVRAAKTALEIEISDYPSPISGCDVQFNHLLAERRRLNDALRAFETKVFIATPRTLSPGAGIESR